LVRVETGFRLVGRYRLQERIGSGGMAEVWRARDEVLGRHVAVKLVNGELRCGPAFHRHFRDEARAAAGLSHPRVVAIFDFDEAEAWNGSRIPYLVMEFLEGETLAERIRRGPLPIPEAVRVCAQIAEAIAAAHQSGIVHHDVKPSNVFLTPNGVKVIDFGIARAIRNEPACDRPDAVLATEPLLGTPGYVAPEQFGRVATTAAVDVYALGVVLTECLTGRRAIDAPLPGEVPVEVAVLCTRARSSNPLSRPSAAEAAEILTLAALRADLRAQKATPAPDMGPADVRLAPEHNRPTPATNNHEWTRPYAEDHMPTQGNGGEHIRALANTGEHIQARANTSEHMRAQSHAEESGRAGARMPDDPRGGQHEPSPSPGPPSFSPGPPSRSSGPAAVQGAKGQDTAAQDADKRGTDGQVTGGRVTDARRRPPHLSGAVAAGALAVTTAALVVHVLLPGPSALSAGPASAPITGSTAVADPPADSPAADSSAARPATDPGAGPGSATPALVSPTATPAKAIAILARMRPLVDEGFTSGEIRSDVAVDLNNVVNNLQNELVGGQHVDLQRRLADLHNKIATRLREGGLTQSRAEKLNGVLAGIIS
jgi:serine/threonine-protein kinase